MNCIYNQGDNSNLGVGSIQIEEVSKTFFIKPMSMVGDAINEVPLAPMIFRKFLLFIDPILMSSFTTL